MQNGTADWFVNQAAADKGKDKGSIAPYCEDVGQCCNLPEILKGVKEVTCSASTCTIGSIACTYNSDCTTGICNADSDAIPGGQPGICGACGDNGWTGCNSNKGDAATTGSDYYCCKNKYCDISSGSTTGTCTVCTDAGSSCTNAYQCSLGNYCDSTTNVCTACGLEGSTCSTENVCCNGNSCYEGICYSNADDASCVTDSTCTSYYCDMPTGSTSGTCTACLAVGDSCPSTNGCCSGSTCDANSSGDYICYDTGNNSTCITNSTCESGYCDPTSDTCQTACLAIDEVCTDSGDACCTGTSCLTNSSTGISSCQTCGNSGYSCPNGSTDCCTGFICTNGYCASSCIDIGDACTDGSSDCCSGSSCFSGTCLCSSSGCACDSTDPSSCTSGMCTDGWCACYNISQACTADTQCCSADCDTISGTCKN